MFNRFLLTTLNLVVCYGLIAQSETHINYYKNIDHQMAALSIEISDIVARTDFSKFKIKFDSKSNDIIIIEPNESSFLISENTCQLDERQIIIDPMGKSSKVFNAICTNLDTHVDNYSFNLSGLYKVSTQGDIIEMPNFILPPSVNDIELAGFKVEMKNIKKTTQITSVDFEIIYTGEGYGLIDASRLGVKIESGQEFANSKTGQKLLMLAKGESGKIVAEFKIPGKIVDMQFANMEILWRDSFRKSMPEKLDGYTFEIEIDRGLTEGKNK